MNGYTMRLTSRRVSLAVLSIVLCPLAQGAAEGAERAVVISSGPITGQEREGVRSFKGIPYCTRFARTGDPNGDGDPTWPAYQATTRQVQSLDTGVKPSQPSGAAATPDQAKPITLRFVPVADSRVTGEITLAPHLGRWSEGMDVTATVHSEKDFRTFRDRHLIVNVFSEPNCRFESSLANFYDPADPKVEHMGVFEPGFWTRTGTWAYHLHPSKLYRRLADPAGFKQMGRWRGRDDVPIQEQVQSIGILSYSRSVPEFMATVLAGVNLSGDPLRVEKVATDEFEPKEPPEDTTPVTVELLPVGNSGVRGKIMLRPYEYQQVGRTTGTAATARSKSRALPGWTRA